MRVGILTFHDTNNFGSWLQTYGLYKKLRDMKVNVEVIDYQCREIIKREKLTWRKAYELLCLKDMDACKLLWRKIKKQVEFGKYTRKYMKRSKKRYTEKDIKSSNLVYDVFMIGSDLVWNTEITGRDLNYLLAFAEEGKRKLAYAASMGYEEIPPKQIEKYEILLKRFDYITVREKSTSILIEKLINVSVPVVADPTMLLTKREWGSFVKGRCVNGDYVLVYFMDDRKQLLRLAKQYASRHHCKVYVISEGTIGGENCISPDNIAEFLSLIYYAKKIFTASYHGLMFSIYFEKQFAYSSRKPESRMSTIAEILGIEAYEIHHLCFDVNKKLEYGIVTPKVKKFRRKSMQELEKILTVFGG